MSRAGLGWSDGLAGQGPSTPGLAGHVGWPATASALRQGAAVWPNCGHCYHEHEARYTSHNRAKLVLFICHTSCMILHRTQYSFKCACRNVMYVLCSLITLAILIKFSYLSKLSPITSNKQYEKNYTCVWELLDLAESRKRFFAEKTLHYVLMQVPRTHD